MATESLGVGPLQWRAAGHAALSDVGRLRVVDSLEVGDISPRDLATALGMSSNLLAHHLKVLQAAGLVRRLPSESDGRRTYVRLVPEALAALGRFPTPALPAGRVVFVCSGNSARSQLAAALWASRTGRPVASAGTRPAARINPGAVEWLEHMGFHCSPSGQPPRPTSWSRPTPSSPCATRPTGRWRSGIRTGRSRTRCGSAHRPPSSGRWPTSPTGSRAGRALPLTDGARA
jgi:DNA-binding MarR family transcriptional regulator